MTQPAVHKPDPPDGLDDALHRIRDHGGRVTRGKRALASLLFADGPPLTVDEIADRLSEHDRSAIYRTLAQFEELGIAEHLHLGHGQAVYRPAGRPTVPVVCNTCGTTVELELASTRAFAKTVLDQTGIALDLSHFPLTGACHDCAEAIEEQHVDP